MILRKNALLLILLIIIPLIVTAYTIGVVKSASTKVYIDPKNRVDLTLTPETPLTLRPDGDGAKTDWTGAYTDWDEADPHDGDSSYVNISSAWGYETSTLQNHTSETWSIAKVKITIWARNTTPTDDMVAPILVFDGTREEWGPQYSFTNETSGGTYMKFTSEWAKNPDTDTYWTWSDIDALEAGVVSYTKNAWDAGLEIRVTQLYVEVTGPLLEVDVRVDSVTDLYSFQFELMFNPEVLNGVWFDQGMNQPVETGPFLGSAGGTVISAGELGYDNTFGRLFLTGAFIVSGSTPTGSGLLATAFFEVVGKGESNLTLGENTGLLQPPPPPGRWIAHQREDGYFRNAPLASMPKAAYTVTPVSTPASLEGYNSTFDATSSTPDGGTIVTYKWYFWNIYHGRTYLDWGIVTDSVTTRNFTMRGTYNITLIVIDDAGFVGIKETYFTILAHDIFFSDITTNATLGPLPPTIIPMANIGDILEVNATVVNEGDFTETNVNVTLFWSANYEGADHYGAIGTQYGITLTAGESRNITFTWDTTGRNVTHPQLIGLHANASRVQYEYDTERVTGKIADNEIVREGPRVRFHDVAITQVTTNATSLVAGEVLEISVTVVNQGDYNETSISVTTYYDGTSISTQMIQVMTNSSFAAARLSGNSTITLTFLWDTTGVSEGIYTISANATWTDWKTEDYEPYDNTYIDGVISMAPDPVPPVADAGPDQTVEQHTLVTFDGSASTDNIRIVSYTWTFMEGGALQTLTGVNPTYTFNTFNTTGVYVTLNVSDPTGNWDTDTVKITVLKSESPVADAGSDQTVDEHTLVTFNGSGSTDNIGITSYTWTFVDVTPQNLTGVNPTYTFQTSGIYTVTLNVTDTAGNSGIDTVIITILDVTTPISDAGSDQTVDEDTLVTFDGSGSSDNVGIVSYAWTFIDVTPQTLSGVNPTYTFATPGVYTVTLNVSDAAGNWATDEVIITVVDVSAPVADAGSDQTVDEDTEVAFDASGSTDNVDIIGYAWDFGDGTTGIGVTSTHTYSEPGTFTVTLTVEDAAGNTATDTMIVTVQAAPEGFPIWIVGAAAAVIVAVIAAIAVFMRRSKG